MEDRKPSGQVLGTQGEDLACQYIESIGHTILERNFRGGHCEIDIISIDAEGIHFIEVKTRSKNIQAPPQENVDYRKQARIVSASKKFLHSRKGIPFRNQEYFFDVIAITFHNNIPYMEWIPQAFIPLYW